jgi:iron complex outermembrane recepter protein
MKKAHYLYLLIIITVLFFSLGDVSALFAQESNSEEFKLEEITVTAQKRAENQQNVAISMDVISGDQMEEMGQNDIYQLLGNLSSATVNKTGSALRIAIRGVSDDLGEDSVSTTTPTAAVNTDGVMTNRPQTGTGYYDIERVEVLVGPQSTLYASASPGGIVNIVTASPKLDKFETSATLEIGNYNLKHGEGALNVPVGDAVALRAAVSINSRDGYNSNGGDDEDQKAARLKALFKPNDKISFLLTGEMSKETGHGFATVKPFNNQSDKYYPDVTMRLTDPWTSAESSLGNAMEKKSYKVYGKMDWDLGPLVLTIQPSYTNFTSPSNSAGFAFTGLYTLTVSKRDSYEKSAEVRLTSSEDFYFKWNLGFIWYKASDKLISDILDKNGPGYNNMINLDTVKAAFGNITYPITDQFRATAGFRFTKDFNHSVQDQTNGPPDLVFPLIVDQTYNHPNYKVGVEYDVNKTSMLYADVTNAYRTQGMAFDAKGKVFPPEELMAFNLGSKNRFFDNKFQVNASAYYYDYKNKLGINFAFYLFSRGNAIVASPDSNAKAVGDYKQYGLDLDTSTIISDKDKLDLSISLTHGEYTHLFFDYIDETNNPIVPGVAGTSDLSYNGKPNTNSPAVTLTGSYNHNFNLWNGSILTARIDGRYKSSYILTFSDQYTSYDTSGAIPTFKILNLRKIRKQEAYYTADLTAIYADQSGKWTLTGYVKNLTNYAVKTSWTYGGPGGGYGNMMIGPPRTYGGLVSIKF